MHEASQALGKALAALSHPVRREILWLSWERARPAGDIADHFDLAPNTISSHLAKLVDAGLLTMTRDGTRRMYRTDAASLGRIHDELDRSFGYRLTDRRHFGPGFQAAPVAGPHQMTLATQLPVPADLVWRWWTTQRGLDQLWGGQSRLELRSQGAFAVDVAGPPVFCLRARIHEVRVRRQLRFSWCFAFGEVPLPPGVASVTLTLASDGNSGAELGLTNYSTDPSLLTYHEALWTTILARSRDLAERGRSTRRIPTPPQGT